MARRPCETLKWFPSPKQCLDLLAEYRPPESPQTAALIACDAFMHRTFADWMRQMRCGAQIGDVPDRWKRIAVEDGPVRRLEDGSYVSRALYHGLPRLPYQPPRREPMGMPLAPPSGPAKPPAPPASAVAGSSEGLVP